MVGPTMAGPLLSMPYINPMEEYSLTGQVILVWLDNFKTDATPLI